MGTAFWKRVFGMMVLGIALGLSARTHAAAPPPAQQIWKDITTRWGTINSYSGTLFAWNYKTQWFIDKFPEHRNKEGKEDKTDWAYRIYGLRFKKPDKALVTYDLSSNEKTEEGSVIDRGIAYVLTYVPGTLLINGVKDKTLVYVVFPYISSSKFNAMPIGPQWKAMMKVLMIASRSEVYWKVLANMKDPRGNTIADLAIGNLMKRYEHYFKDGKVSSSMSPQYDRDDFDITKDGWLTFKKGISKPATIWKITMVPKDVKKNRGITKVETFIDPKTKMFTGLVEYENGKLVQVLLFATLKLNVDLPDNLWEDPFRGRRLSDKK